MSVSSHSTAHCSAGLLVSEQTKKEVAALGRHQSSNVQQCSAAATSVLLKCKIKTGLVNALPCEKRDIVTGCVKSWERRDLALLKVHLTRPVQGEN